MPNTYTQLNVHCVFCVKGRENIITKGFRDNLHRYMSGILKNDNRLVLGRFQWQEGYAAFSYSRSQRDTVTQYILNQEAHHKTKIFREEYIELLEKLEIPYEERYLFEFYD